MRNIPEPEDDGTVQICVVLGSDDEVAAAEYTENVLGDPEHFFNQTLDNCGRWEIGTIYVPAELAAQLVVQGTSDQHFSDGYEAQNALATAVPGQMGDENLWTSGDDEDDDWDDDWDDDDDDEDDEDECGNCNNPPSTCTCAREDDEED